MKYIPILFVCMGLMSCGMKIEGEFGWARTDDRDIGDVEKNITHVSEYALDVDALNFYDYETIWWMYIIRSGSYEREGFLAALYENNNTPQPVEVDLRQVYVEKNGGENIIRQSYSPLRPGRYLIRLANESIVIAEKDFVVFPAPGSTRFDENASDGEENTDPIVEYSGL